MAKGTRQLIGMADELLDDKLRLVDQQLKAALAERAHEVADQASYLRRYADGFRDAQARRQIRKVPKVVAEYVSPAGNKYLGCSMNRADFAFEQQFLDRVDVPLVDPKTGEHLAAYTRDGSGRNILDPGSPRKHHLGCAEIGALYEAWLAEGEDGLQRGGRMSALRVKSVDSPTRKHGTPISPCEEYCDPLLAMLGTEGGSHV